jgi:membrane-associated phospholipid phosphatase
MNFKEAFSNKNFTIEFITTIIFLVVVLISLSAFLNFIEMRDGVVLHDPLLEFFSPIDLTWLIFGLLYFSLITTIVIFSRNPALLMFAFQSYILMVIFRMSAIYSLPLNPPSGMIPLNDPVVEYFGTGQLLTRDLFFSGHTATLFLLFLLSDKKLPKIFFLISTIVVGFSVLFQHVHYSIDVFAAPFFAYCSFIIVKKIRKRLHSS